MDSISNYIMFCPAMDGSDCNDSGFNGTTGARGRGVGKLDDHWRDVLLLERRSEKIGL